jgi:replicative DNA helicase
MAIADQPPVEPTALDAALGYARRGWRVIPIPPGRKHPGIAAWQREGTTDEQRIRHWWTSAPEHGVGIVTGAESGIWVLDVDVSGDKAGDDTLAELTDGYGALPDTYEVVTGSGGRHIYFAWPEGQEIRNDAGRRLGPGLDVRGEGGQVLAPPTIHPNGQPYAVEASAPDHVAPAPGWLLAKLADPEPSAHEGNDRSTDDGWRTVTTGDRPGDDFADQVTWAQLLEPDGWTLGHIDRSGEQHWVRPGKTAREGTSATVGYKGSDVLKVFTSSHPTLHENETYTKLGYVAATQHGGDHSAAARALREKGYGASVDSLPNAPRPAVDPDEPWPDLIPLGVDHAPPPFPLHVFPDWIAQHCAEISDDLQTPVDLPAMLALGALSTIAAGHVRLAVHGRWVENVNTYGVIAMPPSTGKSPAYKAVMGPVLALEAEHGKAIRAQVAANQDVIDSLEGELKRAKQLDSPDPHRLADIRERLFDAEDRPTTIPKLTVGDATPEALAKLMADNGGRMAVHSTEGGVFDLMTGRYSDRSNLDVYLQGWSGDRLDTARIGREANVAPEAILTMVLTVQPSVIAALSERPELAGRGLTARFMYSVPVDTLGHRDLSFRPTTHDAAETYHEHMLSLGRAMIGWLVPSTWQLGPDAAAMYAEWRQDLEHRRRPDGDLRAMAEWTGKLESTVLRAAALLRLAWHGYSGTTVDADMMALALDLGAYWLEHAAIVHDLWGANETVRDGRQVLAWLDSNTVERFTIRDLYAAMRRRFPTADSTLPVLDLLIERGWIRVVEGELAVGRRGKQSAILAVRPRATARNSDAERSEGSQTAAEVRAMRAMRVSHKSEPLSLSSEGHTDTEQRAHGAHGAQPRPVAETAESEPDSSTPAFEVDPWSILAPPPTEEIQ